MPTIAGSAPEEEQVGLAVPSGPHTRPNVQGDSRKLTSPSPRILLPMLFLTGCNGVSHSSALSVERRESSGNPTAPENACQKGMSHALFQTTPTSNNSLNRRHNLRDSNHAHYIAAASPYRQ